MRHFLPTAFPRKRFLTHPAITRALFAAILAVGLFASVVHAQFPPAATKNIKALPTAISVSAVIDTMKAFTRALGVRCSYCHVGAEGQDLAQYDFASDEKPAKVKARQMIAMVNGINADYLAKLVNRKQPSIAVTCITCHRGVTEPRPVQQVVMSAYDAAGIDSAITAYRALRTRYYGRSAYDFGEVPLVDVADAIRQRGNLPDAMRLYSLNTELVPNSTYALRSAAGGFLAVGDTTSAVAAFQKALSINPNDQQSRDALKALGH